MIGPDDFFPVIRVFGLREIEARHSYTRRAFAARFDALRGTTIERLGYLQGKELFPNALFPGEQQGTGNTRPDSSIRLSSCFTRSLSGELIKHFYSGCVCRDPPAAGFSRDYLAAGLQKRNDYLFHAFMGFFDRPVRRDNAKAVRVPSPPEPGRPREPEYEIRHPPESRRSPFCLASSLRRVRAEDSVTDKIKQQRQIGCEAFSSELDNLGD